jgi:16S rRNA A1518/A1519 N6-dimethyltransferase RsmA/KsgA/DIM1 with predicted DNA glycosylase/AP lyase activity
VDSLVTALRIRGSRRLVDLGYGPGSLTLLAPAGIGGR